MIDLTWSDILLYASGISALLGLGFLIRWGIKKMNEPEHPARSIHSGNVQNELYPNQASGHTGVTSEEDYMRQKKENKSKTTVLGQPKQSKGNKFSKQGTPRSQSSERESASQPGPYESPYADGREQQHYEGGNVQEPSYVPESPARTTGGDLSKLSEKEILIRLLGEMVLIREALEKREHQQDRGQQREAQRTIPRESKVSHPPEPRKLLCRLYNESAEDLYRRQEFRDRFKVVRLGVYNLQQRVRDKSVDPEFQAANDGEYYAVELEERGRRYYGVVPMFDLTFQDLSHGPGAMGIVFRCPGFNPHLKYRHVKVASPAIFEREGQAWVLREQGELELGPSDT